MRREPGDREDLASKPGCWNMTQLPRGYTSHRQPYPVLDSGVVLSMFMDDVLVTGLATWIHGDPPTPPSETSEIPELVTGEDFEATPPYEERLSTSARTRLDRVCVEMAQGGQQ
ncbi:hypothetical protein K438DRAFT_1761184 [Mycena galopus ATCC 62051]|nr:hypothetical protein K438DRAFT_1761184 [Mycena galopus ATCC 62051]